MNSTFQPKIAPERLTGIVPPVPIEILAHPEAPLFAAPDALEVLQQVLQVVESGNFSVANEEIRQVIRQAGYSSLWFFLAVIAAYNGPYERLTNHLHVDMANNYQKFMYPGSWSAFFLPRSAFKSTLVTYGANGWELLRDVNLTIAMGSAVSDRSYDFLHETQRIFDSNEFFQWLYPEYVPSTSARSWNDKEMTLPNRTRRKVAPSIQILSVGASSQGVHVELLKLDDIVGDAQLTSDRGANADMRRIGNWFKSNKRTLIEKPEESRIVVVGTRYGIDDPYESIMESLKSKHGGGWDSIPRKEREDGEWHVYYRQAIEKTGSIFPEAISEDFISKIREDDPWTYLTQYLNNPYTQETAEMSIYTPAEANADYNADDDEWYISWTEGPDKYCVWKLSDCDVVAATDPAGTERNQMTVKSSRSASAVVATCPDGTVVLIELFADYVPISTVFDWMFTIHSKWHPRLHGLEQNGPFKILGPLLRDEQERRKTWISTCPTRSTTDKDARIRSELQPRLERNKIKLTSNVRKIFMGELISFPGGNLKDSLDAVSQALSLARIPPDPKELEEEDYEEELALMGRSRYTGY